MRRTRVVSLGLTLAVGLVMASAAPGSVGASVGSEEAAGVTGAQCYYYATTSRTVCTPGTHFTCYPMGCTATVPDLVMVPNGNSLKTVPCPCGTSYYLDISGFPCSGS